MCSPFHTTFPIALAIASYPRFDRHFYNFNNIMPPRVRGSQWKWEFPRPGVTDKQLNDLAADLRTLRGSNVTVKPDKVLVRMPTETLGRRRHIDSQYRDDNACLSESITFIPSSPLPGSPANANSSAGRSEGTVILQYKESGKNVTSCINNVSYIECENGKISLHNLSRDQTFMMGGDFEGGTRVDSENTPGFFSLKGATYTSRSYSTSEHPQDQHSYDTPTTDTMGSQTSERAKSPGRDGAGTLDPNPASALFLQTIGGLADDETGSETESASPSRQVLSDDWSYTTPTFTPINQKRY